MLTQQGVSNKLLTGNGNLIPDLGSILLHLRMYCLMYLKTPLQMRCGKNKTRKNLRYIYKTGSIIWPADTEYKWCNKFVSLYSHLELIPLPTVPSAAFWTSERESHTIFLLLLPCNLSSEASVIDCLCSLLQHLDPEKRGNLFQIPLLDADR